MVVVCDLNEVRRDDLDRVWELITGAGGHILGAVLDKGSHRRPLRGLTDGGPTQRKSGRNHARAPRCRTGRHAAAASGGPPADGRGARRRRLHLTARMTAPGPAGSGAAPAGQHPDTGRGRPARSRNDRARWSRSV